MFLWSRGSGGKEFELTKKNWLFCCMSFLQLSLFNPHCFLALDLHITYKSLRAELKSEDINDINNLKARDARYRTFKGVSVGLVKKHAAFAA